MAILESEPFTFGVSYAPTTSEKNLMDSDIDNIIKNSNKAELLENLAIALEHTDKVVVVLISDKAESDDEGYTSMVMTLGLKTTYEAYGLLEVAKQDLQDNDY